MAGKKTLVSDGQEITLVSEGQEITLVSDGQEITLVSDGNGKDLTGRRREKHLGCPCWHDNPHFRSHKPGLQ